MNQRMTIAGMLAFVAIVAMVFASLRSASAVWTSAMATLTLVALMTGVLGAIVLRGPERAFWLGFALFGWGYLILVDWDWVGGQFGHDLTAWLGELADQLMPQEVIPQNAPFPAVANRPRSGTITLPYGSFEKAQQRLIKVGNFVEIGRMGMGMVLAMVGGLIGRGFAARVEASRSNRPE